MICQLLKGSWAIKLDTTVKKSNQWNYWAFENGEQIKVFYLNLGPADHTWFSDLHLIGSAGATCGIIFIP